MNNLIIKEYINSLYNNIFYVKKEKSCLPLQCEFCINKKNKNE